MRLYGPTAASSSRTELAVVASEVNQVLRTGEHSSPKTVLGFFGVVLLIVVGGSTGLILALSSSEKTVDYVPYVLGFSALVVVALLTTVVTAMVKDPTRLMLGQITGREYIDHRRLTLGDSTSGEFELGVVDVVEGQVALPAATDASNPKAES